MTPFFAEKILTPRLCLRKLDEKDIPLVVGWSNCEVAHGSYLTPEKFEERESLAALRAGTFWSADNKLFLIERKSGSAENDPESTPIGTLHCWLRPERKNCAVMALKISSPHDRNKGFGTEAQKYAIIQMFSKLKIHSVEMYTDINNFSQQRCLQKLGFELVETLCYDDREIKRVGNLYRLDTAAFTKTSVYHYHYEC